ncbi:MAG: AAA family ATPase [Proteobacteria bacterium]|nr:AAA family ATPase [Pseudomonadota bacterium]
MNGRTINVIDYHNAGFPAIWIRTHEPERAKRDVVSQLAGGTKPLEWNVLQGLFEALCPERQIEDTGLDESSSPVEVLDWFAESKGPAILLLENFHFFSKGEEVIQAIANRRADFQQKGNMIVVISPKIDIPLELQKIFKVLTFDLPTREELRKVFLQASKDADIEEPAGDELDRILDSAVGLTENEAENAAALCIATTDQLASDIISDLRADMIRQSATLEVGRFEEKLDDVKGYDTMKDYILRSLKTDKYRGVLVVGIAGTGKSMFAKAIGNEVGRDTIIADVNKIMAAGEALVGQAEAKAEQTIDIIDSQGRCIVMFDEIEKGLGAAYSGFQGDSGSKAGVGSILLRWMSDRPRGKAYVIATCNKIDELPAEWKRAGRWDAIFFADLPDDESQVEILEHFCLREEISYDDQPLPKMIGWTGAEIEQMVLNASMLGCNLTDAAEYVTPITEIDPERVKALRSWAFPNGFDQKGRCILATSREKENKKAGKEAKKEGQPKRHIKKREVN